MGYEMYQVEDVQVFDGRDPGDEDGGSALARICDRALRNFGGVDDLHEGRSAFRIFYVQQLRRESAHQTRPRLAV